MKYKIKAVVLEKVGAEFKYFTHRYHIEAENDEEAKKETLHLVAVLFSKGIRVVYHHIFKTVGYHEVEVH
ncbi:MAG: hypothetical protein KGN01_08340 [Patescibacteria group bacterium]|nr:hypothetical protein [Patescibacteria group bacterium]